MTERIEPNTPAIEPGLPSASVAAGASPSPIPPTLTPAAPTETPKVSTALNDPTAPALTATEQPRPDSKVEPAPAADQPADAKARSSLLDRLPPLRGLGGVMLVGLLLIAVLGWQWLDLRHRVSQTQEQLARRLADGAVQLRDAKALAANAQEALQAQANKITVLEAKLVDLNSQQGALEGLYQELSRGRDEWLLSEVDQLIGLAGQQLQLAGNVQGAIAVLSNADARLARSERPQFVSLRKSIAKDLQKLRNLPLVDVPGVALRLENAALAVDQMGLAFEARPQNSTAPTAALVKGKAVDKVREPTQVDWTAGVSRWFGEVWQEIHALVRIERFNRPEPAVLAPHNTVFLRENLKLRLLGARLALLGRDQATFRGELRQAVQWLDKYFDPRDKNVESALEALKPLLATDLSVEAPALSESQNALRAVKLAANRVIR